MKISTVLKPTALFAAGSFAAAAQAAPIYEYENYNATEEGTLVAIGGASTAQYSFSSVKLDTPFGPATGYFLDSNDGTARTTALPSSMPSFPSEAEASNTSVKTGTSFSVATLAVFDPSVTSDDYVGLRFNIGDTRYTGYAGLINGGSTINQIVYQQAVDAGVPEPQTWALMLAGFGGIGFAMRRRQRQAPAALAA